MVDGRQTVTINEAAKRAGVCRRTVHNWMAAEKLEYVRTAGGSVRIFVDTLFRRRGTDKVGVSHESLTAGSGETHTPPVSQRGAS